MRLAGKLTVFKNQMKNGKDFQIPLYDICLQVFAYMQ